MTSQVARSSPIGKQPANHPLRFGKILLLSCLPVVNLLALVWARFLAELQKRRKLFNFFQRVCCFVLHVSRSTFIQKVRLCHLNKNDLKTWVRQKFLKTTPSFNTSSAYPASGRTLFNQSYEGFNFNAQFGHVDT